MIRLPIIAILIILAARLTPKEQTAVAVWSGKNCIALSETVRATAPLKDGLPDYKNVHLTGVRLDSKCMSYEIQK